MYISSSCEYLSSLNPIASIKSTSKAPSSVTHTPINTRKHSECLPAAADHLLLQNQIGGTSHPVCRLPPADGLTLAQSPRPGHNRMIRPTSWKEGLQCSCQVCLRAFVFTDVFSWVRGPFTKCLCPLSLLESKLLFRLNVNCRSWLSGPTESAAAFERKPCFTSQSWPGRQKIRFSYFNCLNCRIDAFINFGHSPAVPEFAFVACKS